MKYNYNYNNSLYNINFFGNPLLLSKFYYTNIKDLPKLLKLKLQLFYNNNTIKLIWLFHILFGIKFKINYKLLRNRKNIIFFQLLFRKQINIFFAIDKFIYFFFSSLFSVHQFKKSNLIYLEIKNIYPLVKNLNFVFINNLSYSMEKFYFRILFIFNKSCVSKNQFWLNYIGIP